MQLVFFDTRRTTKHLLTYTWWDTLFHWLKSPMGSTDSRPKYRLYQSCRPARVLVQFDATEIGRVFKEVRLDNYIFHDLQVVEIVYPLHKIYDCTYTNCFQII